MDLNHKKTIFLCRPLFKGIKRYGFLAGRVEDGGPADVVPGVSDPGAVALCLRQVLVRLCGPGVRQEQEDHQRISRPSFKR